MRSLRFQLIPLRTLCVLCERYHHPSVGRCQVHERDRDESGPLVEADESVPLPALVIFLGMVDIEMQPPAFVAI